MSLAIDDDLETTQYNQHSALPESDLVDAARRMGSHVGATHNLIEGRHLGL